MKLDAYQWPVVIAGVVVFLVILLGAWVASKREKP